LVANCAFIVNRRAAAPVGTVSSVMKYLNPRRAALTRSNFLAASAAFGAAAMFVSPLTARADGAAISPFRFEFSEADLVDLRRRINATKWPDKEIVADASQGVQLATMQELARYWATGYDWRAFEGKLNSLPQFITNIDGLDIHFIHVRSKHANALPLVVTHGWPGSIVEQLKIIDPLTNPTAHGGRAEDAFHLVIPSMPGYGFSGKPASDDWGGDRIARAWVTLMKRLGYTRFVAQGGDWGSRVSAEMAKQSPSELLGIHVNLPQAVPHDIALAVRSGDPPPSGLSAEETRAYEQLRDVSFKHAGLILIMGTRPQTLYSLADSPVGLAAFMLDHDLRSYKRISGLFVDGEPYGALSRDDILDNITLYWLTNTAISSARLYWEDHSSILGVADVSAPTAVSVFPDEIYQAPRSWVEQAYHKLVYYNQPAQGGHFAAWEQPQLFTEEVRNGFQSLRAGAH
jgi:pimeloyl-ACP methyl ester carboxylesterase